MDNFNFNLLKPDRDTDPFADVIYSRNRNHENIPVINKTVKISTTMTLISNI